MLSIVEQTSKQLSFTDKRSITRGSCCVKCLHRASIGSYTIITDAMRRDVGVALCRRFHSSRSVN